MLDINLFRHDLPAVAAGKVHEVDDDIWFAKDLNKDGDLNDAGEGLAQGGVFRGGLQRHRGQRAT